jgi:hypothetical protein
MNWYAKDVSGHQALVIEEDTGRSVAVAYDKRDAALLAAAPKLRDELTKWVEWHESPTMANEKGITWMDILKSARSVLQEAEKQP